jgi:hypothetical protein
VWWLTPVIPATWEAEIRRIVGPGQPGQKARSLISKVTRAKRAGGGAQVVERLPHKHKVLSSNPGTTKKKKKIIALAVKTETHGDPSQPGREGSHFGKLWSVIIKVKHITP